MYVGIQAGICSNAYFTVYVTCVSVWAKAVPLVAGSVHVSMLYLNITFILNTTELLTVPTNNNQQLTRNDRYMK